MKTTVVFRVLQGEVIALFPTLPGTSDPRTCESYMHVGQHGAADIGLVLHTRLAKPDEYASLAKELAAVGYDLDIRKRITSAHNRKRCS